MIVKQNTKYSWIFPTMVCSNILASLSWMLAKLCMLTFLRSYPLFSKECYSPLDGMLFFEVTILAKLRKVSPLSLKLSRKWRLQISKTQGDLFPSKGTKFLYPKNFDYNWFLDETQFLGGLAGYKLVKLRSIICHTRFTALLHIWTRESFTEINQIW